MLTCHYDKAILVMIHDISVTDRTAAVTAYLDHAAGYLITSGNLIQHPVVEYGLFIVIIHVVCLRDLFFTD